MKKMLMFGLLSLFMIPNVIFAMDNDSYFTTGFGKELTYQQYEKMQNLGYDDEKIRRMPNEFIDKYLSENLELVSSESQTIQEIYTFNNSDMVNQCFNNCTFDDVRNGAIPISVDEMEVSNELFEQFQGEVATPYATGSKSHVYNSRKMTTYVFYDSAKGAYKIANFAEWDGVPSGKSFDINAVAFKSPGVVIMTGSQSAYQSYEEYKITLFGHSSSEFKVINYSTNSDHYRIHTNGIGIAMNLANGSGLGYGTENHVSYLEYYVKKNVTNTINTLDVIGRYKHASGGTDFTDFIGLSIDATPTNALTLAILVSNSVSKKYDEGNYCNLVLTNMGW